MPINGPSSYVPTLNEFLRHWPNVNTALGAPLVLPGGATLLSATEVRDELEDFVALVQGKLNDVEIGRGQIEILKLASLERIGEFNRKVRGFLGQTAFVSALPDVPSITSAAARFIEPLEDMANLWGKINAATIPGFTGPLLLLGGYSLATFNTDLTALKAAYTGLQDASQSLSLERLRRNEVQDQAYAIMRDYRAAVIGSFAPEAPLVLSLPRLTPVGGSTPASVTATVVWDADEGQARITWTESTAASLAQYGIRFCPGPDYSTDDETLVGSVEPTEPRVMLTLAGLPNPDSVASYKVYVITTEGNESGSNAVSVTRPE